MAEDYTKNLVPLEDFEIITEIGDMDNPTKMDNVLVITAVGMTGGGKHAFAICRPAGAAEDSLERFQVLCEPEDLDVLVKGTELYGATLCTVSAPRAGTGVDDVPAVWEPLLPTGRLTQAGPRLYHPVFLLDADEVKVGRSPKSVLGNLMREAKAKAEATA